MVPSGSSRMISIPASSDPVAAAGRLREKRKADPASAPVFRKLRRCMLILVKGFRRRVRTSAPYEKTFTHFCQLLRVEVFAAHFATFGYGNKRIRPVGARSGSMKRADFPASRLTASGA